MAYKRDVDITEVKKRQQKMKLRDIANYYGRATQSRQCIEECAELIQAINKWDRAQSSGDPEKVKKAVGSIVEEIADVRIMLDQLTFLYGCNDEVKRNMDEKINRQIVRIGMEIGMGIAKDMEDNNG